MSEFTPDALTARLARLAPAVDLPAGRDLFDRTRSSGSGRNRPTWWLAAAVVALATAGAIAVWAVARDHSSEVTAPLPSIDGRQLSWTRSAPTPGADTGFALIEDAATLAAAIEPSGGEVPLVDFRHWAVVSVALPLDRCEAMGLADYEVDADRGTWTLRLGPPLLAPTGGPLPNGAPDPDTNDPVCTPDGSDEINTILRAVERVDLMATARAGSVRFVAEGVSDLVVPAESAVREMFGVAGVASTSRDAGGIRFAESADELPAAVVGSDLAATGAAVDFRSSVVVVFDVAATDCPPDAIVDFEITDETDGPVWVPRFAAAERSDRCGTSAGTASYAVVVDRADLPDQVAFRTPDDVGGASELSVSVAATDPTPPSDDVTFGPEPAGEWSEIAVGPDGRTLRLSFVGAAELARDDRCTVRYLPVVSETDRIVRVDLFGERPVLPRAVIEDDAFEPIVCGRSGTTRTVEVVLADPLGDRTVDGWSGPVGTDPSLVTPIEFGAVDVAFTRSGPMVQLA